MDDLWEVGVNDLQGFEICVKIGFSGDTGLKF